MITITITIRTPITRTITITLISLIIVLANRLAFLFSMENKAFEFKHEEFGVRVSKKHHGRRWDISLVKDDFIWWINELLQIWLNSVPLVRTRRTSGCVLTLRLCQNPHGRFFTL